MKNNLLLTCILRRSALPALLLAVGLMLGACGVTGPDDAPWKNVAAYSWPTTEGTSMFYRVDVIYPTPGSTQDTLKIEQSDYYDRQGRTMYRLHDAHRSFKVRILYLPTSDTLFVTNEEFGGAYHLVGPLEKGNTWISGYSDDAEKIPSWRATIVERFSHLQLEGKKYDNVVVTKYELLDTAASDYGSYWLRYYAQGQGPIQTIKHLSLRRDQSGNAPLLPTESQPITRTVLISSTAASN